MIKGHVCSEDTETALDLMHNLNYKVTQELDRQNRIAQNEDVSPLHAILNI